MDGSGLDSDGRQFAKASEMWELEIGTGSAGGEGNGTGCGGGGDKRRDWYRKGIAYWQVNVSKNVFIAASLSLIGFLLIFCCCCCDFFWDSI